MIDLLVATVAFTVVVALLTVALVLATVAPLYAGVQMAEDRGFSTTRWVGVTAAGIAVGLGSAYVLRGGDLPTLVAVLPVALTWAGPAVLWLLDAGQQRIGGRAGAHE